MESLTSTLASVLIPGHQTFVMQVTLIVAIRVGHKTVVKRQLNAANH